jgi:hypothetical protein
MTLLEELHDSQSREAQNYGHETRVSRNQEWMCWRVPAPINPTDLLTTLHETYIRFCVHLANILRRNKLFEQRLYRKVKQTIYISYTFPARRTGFEMIKRNGCYAWIFELSHSEIKRGSRKQSQLRHKHKKGNPLPSFGCLKLKFAFHLLSIFWRNESRLMRAPWCVCVCVSPLTTSERLYQSASNLVCISLPRHLTPSQRSTS